MLRESNANLNPESFSLIRSVTTFGKASGQINVIVSKTSSIAPILQFHSTAVIRKDHIFCGYPALTFRHLARVNAGPLYFNRFRSRTIAALWKYTQRCFRYISCDSTHLSKYTCKSITRSLTDSGCMWIDLNNLPRASATPLELFQRYGFLNME